ncbi:MAG TPA: HPP family protein [Kiritimatiellia bacterium]|nr:HPP family protein [Kiritimatiellia bacterium]HRZ11215.1 HPP family protein [Kiritimatiellia bacterium]HSA19066.1 HPP family protein [Kiritimatiellia bacterium]
MVIGWDIKFRTAWPYYMAQSLAATAVVFLVLLVLHRTNAVVVASIGSSVYILFALPESPTAGPRRVIGGHAAGLLCGGLWALVPHTSPEGCAAVYALAIGSSLFLMVVTDTEHPPASGTALGVAITGASLALGLSLMVSVTLLSLAHRLLRGRLKNLL